ncbi:membrane-bound alkaline phosphatase-like [Macrosteles quadrilineatus]|uniref:membrane-bound alkaline phosphatase-like n=1 Tax=Macrosteles quadrilineatus TaxID=74068 RepID=UPI0023E1C270|nr:membrane-bound alkaline phosphatase-like [Macrosteles quadrilineatus]
MEAVRAVLLVQLIVAGIEAALTRGQQRAAAAVEKDGKYWLDQGLRDIQERLTRRQITGRAKNVIMFLGDGMSVTTVTAARIYQGQQEGRSGEESVLSFEKFPWTGLSKTYCVNSQVADSACSATAYLGGVKANIGTIGVTANVKMGDCHAMTNTSNHVTSVLEWARRAGKSTGIVTTTRVTHASPAGTYAHTAKRDWEGDQDVKKDKEDPEVCPDIATQLVTQLPGRDINVILGGGRSNFVEKDIKDEEGREGRRKDSQNLIKMWAADKERRNATHKYVWDKQGLLKLDTNTTDYLLGLFSASHIPYALHAGKKRPSLTLMVQKALEILKKNPNGYFLFVEGGRIDHAHHDTEARRALHETVEFSEAVDAAVQAVKEDDTLIVVTADHAHTMTMSGYPARGNDILGLAGTSDIDYLPYSTLSYANGPSNHDRHDFSRDNMERDDYKFPSAVPERVETHGGDDVSVYARGPRAHLLTGVMEQSTLASVMGYAACIGPHQQICEASTNHLQT